MKPEHFVELAAKLANGQTEAEWRSAVSRAYYGLFHVARKCLDRLGFRVPREQKAHRYLILRLSNAQYPAVEEVRHALDKIREDRNLADYDLRKSVERNAAINVVQKATAMYENLEKTIQDQTIATMITDVIRAYERDVLKDPTWQPPKK